MSMLDLLSLSSQPSEQLFDLMLDDGSMLCDLEIVRRVPNKRLVCRGQWQGRNIYAKLFIGLQAQRYAERDAAGIHRLIKAGIETPALIHSASLQANQGSNSFKVLIFEAVPNGVNAEEVLSRASESERLWLAFRLIDEVARHHNAGLMQTDLYLKNFLVAGDRIYTLDGDAIKPLPRLFANKAAIDNLIVLLSKFDVIDMHLWLGQLVERYREIRGFPLVDVQDIQKRITRYRRQTVTSYAEKKVFRKCTDVDVLSTFRYFLAISRGPDDKLNQALAAKILDAPDALVEGQQHARLKSGNTCTVSVAEINGRKLVVKRYNIKSFWHWLDRCWRPSRAAKSWTNAHRLIMYGIATAAPVALLEKRFGPLRGKAFFLAEYVEAPNVADLLGDVSVSKEQKKSVAEALAKLMYKLMLLQIVHGDLKASNIHIDGKQPVLIDLDSLQEYKCKAMFETNHVRDLKRLLKNWQDQPEIMQWLIEALQKVYGEHYLLAKALYKN